MTRTITGVRARIFGAREQVWINETYWKTACVCLLRAILGPCLAIGRRKRMQESSQACDSCLDVRVGRFHACRAQQETFSMRFSERTVDQTSSVDDSASSSMTHPFFVSLHELTPDRECVLYARAVVER